MAISEGEDSALTQTVKDECCCNTADIFGICSRGRVTLSNEVKAEAKNGFDFRTARLDTLKLEPRGNEGLIVSKTKITSPVEGGSLLTPAQAQRISFDTPPAA